MPHTSQRSDHISKGSVLAGEVAHVLSYYGLRGVDRRGKWAAGGMILEVLVKEVSIGSGQVDRPTS